MKQKNYIDAKGNYHNVENLTLTQIHDRASEEGYRLGKAEAFKAQPEVKGDLISREALKEAINENKDYWIFGIEDVIDLIDNAPTVEVPGNAVNCVLTMFGKCSYNETGCSDCEIKDKIRKALSERPL